MNKSCLLLPLTLFVVSCDTTTKVEEPTINYLDISGKDQIKLVDEYWNVAKRTEPRYPVSAAQGYKVRSSYPKGVFDKNAAAALVKWKWQATEKNTGNTPILTSIRMDFSTNRNPSDPEYLQNCQEREISSNKRIK